MVKCKIKIKDYRLYAKVQLPIGTSIDQTDLDRFLKIMPRGFLKPEQIKRTYIAYTGPVGVSLSTYLEKPISKYDFFFVIEQAIEATQTLQKNSLPWGKVIWDIKNTFINEVTKEIQFTYLPLQQEKNSATVTDFLEAIIYAAKPREECDTGYVSRFVYFLKNMNSYDPKQLEMFIAGEDHSIIDTIKSSMVSCDGSNVNAQKNRCDYSAVENFDDDEATGLLQNDNYETGLLEQDDDETGLLVEEVEHYATLYRILTGEVISINKPVFRLGKEKAYVDYFITNNNAVSRSHADIVTKNGGFYVKDLNSTNKTFVDDIAIPAQCEYEIFDGCRLKLGNEEFVFNI